MDECMDAKRTCSFPALSRLRVGEGWSGGGGARAWIGGERGGGGVFQKRLRGGRGHHL